MKAQVAGARKITKVVITRSRKGNAELARNLKALGFEPVAIDTIEFLPPEDWSKVDASLRTLGEFDWLLFTSPTGAEFFARRMGALSLPSLGAESPRSQRSGRRRAPPFKGTGIEVDFVPSEYLTKALAEQLPRGRGNHLLVLRADVGDPEVVATLERRGFRVTDLAIYRTSGGGGGEATEKELRDADAIVFASPSAVEAFMKRLDSATTASVLTKRLLTFCIGPVTATASRDHGFEQIITAKTYTLEGLIQELGAAAKRAEAK